MITVCVAWGAAGRADELVLSAKDGTTIENLLQSASVRARIPAGVLAQTARFGVWGKARPPSYVLREGDRVELYRPLRADPKEQRRKRAG